MNLYYETGDELMHYGRKGMKWYQHIYGAAKTAGRGVRRGASAVSVAVGKAASNYKTKQQERKEAEARKRPKSVKDMTDEELSNATKRLQAEQNYVNLQRNISNLSPKNVSAGKKILETVANQVITPVAVNAGKKWLEGKLNKKSEIETLKEEADKATTLRRKLQAEDWLSEREKKVKQADAEQQAQKATRVAAQKIVDEYNKYHESSANYSKKGSDIIGNVFGNKKSNEIMSLSTASKEFTESASRGKRYMQDILDKYGNVLISDYSSVA